MASVRGEDDVEGYRLSSCQPEKDHLAIRVGQGWILVVGVAVGLEAGRRGQEEKGQQETVLFAHLFWIIIEVMIHQQHL